LIFSLFPASLRRRSFGSDCVFRRIQAGDTAEDHEVADRVAADAVAAVHAAGGLAGCKEAGNDAAVGADDFGIRVNLDAAHGVVDAGGNLDCIEGSGGEVVIHAVVAAQILSLKSDLDAEMADILKRDVGVLNVAFANMRCSYMLPATLPAFRARHPNVKVNVFEGTSDQNDRRLLEGQVDVAFYTHPGEENPLIEYHPLASEELLICTCRDHPLAEKALPNGHSPYPRLELKMLKDELVILMRPEQRTRQIVDSILHENRIHFDNILYTSNIQAIMGLVSSGYGVSFVFDSHLKHRIDDNPIDCYSFGNPCTRYDFVAATRKRSYLPRYVEDFIEIVRQAV